MSWNITATKPLKIFWRKENEIIMKWRENDWRRENHDEIKYTAQSKSAKSKRKCTSIIIEEKCRKSKLEEKRNTAQKENENEIISTSIKMKMSAQLRRKYGLINREIIERKWNKEWKRREKKMKSGVYEASKENNRKKKENNESPIEINEKSRKWKKYPEINQKRKQKMKKILAKPSARNNQYEKAKKKNQPAIKAHLSSEESLHREEEEMSKIIERNEACTTPARIEMSIMKWKADNRREMKWKWNNQRKIMKISYQRKLEENNESYERNEIMKA